MLAEVTLHSGRKFSVNLGTNLTFEAKSFSEAQLLGFNGLNGSKYILLGSEVESIEAYEGEIEVEIPDAVPVQVTLPAVTKE